MNQTLTREEEDAKYADRIGHYSRTYSGLRFYHKDPREGDIDIFDIAHHLSNLCRFTGATSSFYSVAQHSVLVAAEVERQTDDRQLVRTALLHDAAEAYLADLARPVKIIPELAFYKVLEERVERVVAQKFDLIYPWPLLVKEADEAACLAERRDLMPPNGGFPMYARETFGADLRPAAIPDKIIGWHPQVAENAFLIYYEGTR